ncbi:TetR/AcrR family transcriptional regulator [Paenibacillus nanensis]|uniref:TetR/AcrR family transcriptional regulator n=1 Tax=Paenibacillus nanensis TaxID=393251 RepID=A0A3A1V087_9BACL|nr:TetR/AcrR family transcriptional regulator [Paenibacillus nanensis]RIX52023.1 TetR/AcrR family transcriptional regulator [Paenibacillus nanensis]
MRKGQITKESIIRESAVLFNTKGYNGASLSDIMEKCGIRKGGIYNHFGNKDEIAIAAFDYSFSQIVKFLSDELGNASNAREKLLAVCQVYIDLIEKDTIAGGCPLLNTAVDSDDGHPALKERAQQAMGYFLDALNKIILEGVDRQELRKDISVEEASTSIVALIEGGVMLSKLFGDSKYIRSCVNHVMQFVEDRLTVKP